MRRRSSVLLAALVALAACDRPNVLVICHNANCVEPTAPEDDDTLPALESSLALEIEGRPVLDGVEVDIFWRAEDSTCLFAHDLEGARSTLSTELVPVFAVYFAQPGELTAAGGPFRIFIEGKATVGVDASQRHTPEQFVLHATCIWDLYTALADAAALHGRELEIVFGSFAPDLLRTLLATAPPTTPVPFRFEAYYGVPKPLDSETRPLSDYAGLPIDIVEVHSQWLLDAQHEGLLSSDIELMFFGFSATVETFAAIEQYEPTMVITSEARLMRRWLDR